MNRKLPQNHLINEGTVIEDFESITGWTVAKGTAILNSDEVKSGDYSFKMTTDDSLYCEIRKNINMTLSDAEEIGLWMYCHTPVINVSWFAINIFEIITSKYAEMSVNKSTMHYGWNLIKFKRGNITLAGGAKFDDTFTSLKITLKAPVGSVAVVSIDSLLKNVKGKPCVVLTFDDGRLSQYTEAFSYMNTKGIKGTCYAIQRLIGTDTFATAEQLTEMYNAGWAIGNHTKDHNDLTLLTQAEVEQQLLENAEYLEGLGFTRSSRHVAYPLGKNNETVHAAMASTGMITGRTVAGDYQNVPPQMPPYTIKCYASVGTPTTLETVISNVEATILKEATAFINFHSIVEAPTVGAEWDRTSFRAFIDYLVARKVICLTVDEWWNGIANPRYKSLPPNR